MWLLKRFQRYPKTDCVTLFSKVNICSFHSTKCFTTVNEQHIHVCILSSTPYRYTLVIHVTCMQFSGKFNYCVGTIFHGIFQVVILLSIFFQLSICICKIILWKIWKRKIRTSQIQRLGIFIRP